MSAQRPDAAAPASAGVAVRMGAGRRLALERRRLATHAGRADDLTSARGLLAWCGTLAAVRDLHRSGDVPDGALAWCEALASAGPPPA